jgi:serine O-acetyltransferase
MKSFKEVKFLLGEDYKRVSKGKSNPGFLILFKKFLANAGFRALFLYRIGNWFLGHKQYFLASTCQRLMHHLAHCWISVSAEIGPGFLIAHVGGIVVGGGTIIGSNFNKESEDGRQQPLVGDNVSFGAGCVIIGPVKVGNNSIIGANSVVTRDIPDGVIASGIPARVIKEVWNVTETGRKL